MRYVNTRFTIVKIPGETYNTISQNVSIIIFDHFMCVMEWLQLQYNGIQFHFISLFFSSIQPILNYIHPSHQKFQMYQRLPWTFIALSVHRIVYCVLCKLSPSYFHYLHKLKKKTGRVNLWILRLWHFYALLNLEDHL